MFSLQLTSLVSSLLLLATVEDHFCHATLSRPTSNISRPVSVGASPVISIKVSNFLNVTDLLIYLDSAHFRTVKIRGKDINITDQSAAEYNSRVNVSYESGPDEVTVLVQFDKIQKADDGLNITFSETTFMIVETWNFVMSVKYCNNSFFEPNATNASESTCGYDCVQTFHCGRSFEPSSFAARCLETAKWNITEAPCKKRVRCIVPAVCNGEDGKMKRQWKDVDEIKQKALTHRLREQFADSLKEISDSYNKARTEFDEVRNAVENLPDPVAKSCRSVCDRLRNNASSLINIPTKYFSRNGTIAVIGIPPDFNQTATVYCDCNTKPEKHQLPHTYGAIVIQRRENGNEMFNGSSKPDYKNLIGDLRQDHWLGLEALHFFTKGNASAQIELVKNGSDGKLEYSLIRYRQFYVSSSNHKYVVWVELKADGNYSSRTENNFDRNSKLPEFMYKNGSGWWFDGSNTNLNAMDAIHWGNSTYDAVQIKIFPGGATEKTSGCRFNLCNNLVPATSRKFCISNRCKCVGPIVTKNGELDWKKECRIPFTKNSSCFAICDNLSIMGTGRDYSTRQTPAHLKFGSKYIEVLCDCSFGNKTDEDYGSITVMKMDADVNASNFSKGFGSPEDKSFWIGTKSLSKIAGENSKIKVLLANDAENYTVTFRKLELNCSAEKMTLKTDVTCEKNQTQILNGPNGWKTVQVSRNDYKIIEMKLLEDKALILEHVCWDKYDSTSVIYNLITNKPEDKANYFYFGEYEDDDADKCAEACAKTDGCVWWTLHLSNFGNKVFGQKCYGRTNYRNRMVAEQNIISGQLISCTDCTKEISELHSSLTDCPVKCSDIESTNKTNEEWCVNDRCSCNSGVINTQLYAECEHCLVPIVDTKSCVDICNKWSETDHKHTSGTTGYMKLDGRYVKVHCDCSSESTGDQCTTYGWMTIYRKTTDECGWGHENILWSTGYGNIERGDFWIGTNIISSIVDEKADTEIILSKNGSRFLVRYDNWSYTKLKNVKYRNLISVPQNLNIEYLIGWYHEGLVQCTKWECGTCSKNPEKYKVEEIKMITDQIQGCETRMVNTAYNASGPCPPRCSDVYPDNTSANWCLRSGCDCSCGGVSSRIEYGCSLCIVRVEENCGTVDDYSQQLLRSSISSSKKFKPVYVRSAQKIILCHQNDRAKDISEPFAASCPEICEQIERNNTLNKPLSPSKTGSVSSIWTRARFFEAYCECDKTDTHNLPPTTGWIVFQRRIDITLFAVGDYENGFGIPSKPRSYWLGVKAIQRLASRDKPAKLQINLVTENNDTYFIRYNKFSLSNDYKLIVEEPAVISKNGTNVTASYQYNHISEPMWTVGQEIEFTEGTGGCERQYWWWDTSIISSLCSLNGAYGSVGIQWYNPNGGGTVHYPFVEMKICPQDWNC